MTRAGACVITADCIEAMREMDETSVDAIVTDPPYGLGFMGKEWDDARRLASVPPSASKPGDRLGALKLGKGPAAVTFDGTAFQAWCEAWAVEALRVLKPGGHLLAFGGTRTYHRLTCALEDAGFEIRDTIAWMYGTGFPKSLDVGKAIDKRPGVARHAEFAAHLAERRTVAGLSCSDVSERVVGTRSGACWNWEHHQFPEAKWWPALRDLLGLDETAWGAVIAEAEREVTATTALTYGYQRSGQRWNKGYDETAPATPDAERWQGWGTALKPAHEPIVVARKPLAERTVAAQVLATGTGALNIDGGRIEHDAKSAAWVDKWSGHEGHPEQPGWGTLGQTFGGNPAGRWPANVALGHAEDCEQVGTRKVKSGASVGHNRKSRSAEVYVYGLYQADTRDTTFADADGNETVEAWSCVEGCPVRMLDEQSGDGGASRFFYVAKASRKERNAGLEHPNDHPTVKPVALMRWLVRLVTPPGGLVLDPFAGSGTTGIAALREGFDFIGVEREAEYAEIARARIIGDAPLFNPDTPAATE